MSYRTVKRLLGETSLERKCRFLFGGGLMLLIAGSFYFYASLNRKLIENTNLTRARTLSRVVMLSHHWKQSELSSFHGVIDQLSMDSLASNPYATDEKGEDSDIQEPSNFDWQVLNKDTTERPLYQQGYEAIDLFKNGQTEFTLTQPGTDSEQGDTYHYYAAMRAKRSCIECHLKTEPNLKEGDLLGAVFVKFPLKKTQKALAMNNAILMATAIVTAFLAMLAAYAIVRYVIVKPVLHLKDVSDGIARGILDLRADIRTGDEFEELSHAFNRMLRHLVTIQEELRGVNTNLDAKVDELAQVNLNLYETNKLKDNFLATMSHELRTPLNSILGFSEVLEQAPNLNEKQQRYVHNIQQSGRELTSLINELLDLAKIESGKMEVQIVETSINDLVSRQVDAISSLAHKKNIDLNLVPAEDLKIVQQDPGKLQQILNNLLSNAVKFTPEGGRVSIYVDKLEDDKFQILVEDTGVGIPLDDQEMIFDKFRQGKSIPGMEDTMTREFGGTGLGLSIVKELTKLLGGEIFLESEFGKGSRFFVQLPLVLTEPEPELISTGFESLLVVDVRHNHEVDIDERR
ncbi:Signal transduction histidine-protein kinase BarA [Polystyrenella longa]|uniref:histidine kinase n=1 Tax=Polystyrenella longa TaxID=2528007 RepID=A0A518CP50_9PLAN|nr:ATP-binding protein [Polystyrenella longa]QDU81001.1 Signal transduction histidine-protein kinase BarA [Polystyrenella longa]